MEFKEVLERILRVKNSDQTNAQKPSAAPNATGASLPESILGIPWDFHFERAPAAKRSFSSTVYRHGTPQTHHRSPRKTDGSRPPRVTKPDLTISVTSLNPSERQALIKIQKMGLKTGSDLSRAMFKSFFRSQVKKLHPDLHPEHLSSEERQYRRERFMELKSAAQIIEQAFARLGC